MRQKWFNTVLLDYSTWGMVYIVKWFHLTPKGHICSIHVCFIDFQAPNTSIPTSVEPLFFKVSTVYLNSKNSPKQHPNNPQTQQNQALHRNQPKFNIYIEIKHQINTNVNSQYIIQNPQKSSILANILTTQTTLSPKPSILNQNKKYQIYILTT